MVLTFEEQRKLEVLKHENKMKRLKKIGQIVLSQTHDLNIEHI